MEHKDDGPIDSLPKGKRVGDAMPSKDTCAQFEESRQPVAGGSSSYNTLLAAPANDRGDDAFGQDFLEEKSAELDLIEVHKGWELDGPVLSILGSKFRSTRKARKPVEHSEIKAPDNLEANLVNSDESLSPASGDVYYMNHPRRGYAVIIDNNSFTMQDAGERSGSDRDASALQKSFLRLGFEVEMYANLTAMDMRAAMQYYSEKNHADRDCFLCAILSHGEEEQIYGTDEEVPIRDMTAPFCGKRCSTLVGKPKIFVVQACRGTKLDHGVDLVVPDAVGTFENKIPTEADFLFAYATPLGFFAWRHTEQGSWFIQALCAQLDKHALNADMDLLKLLTRVSREVAFGRVSNHPSAREWHGKKQAPSIVSTLTKDLVFTPKARGKLDP